MIKSNPDLYCSIVLAAGFSSRMGSFKPIMYLGKKTLLEHVISLYKSLKINNIIVVTGYQSDHINNIASQHNVKTVYNAQYKQGMFSSVLAGIAQLPRLSQYFFVHPVDIPLVRSNTISRLIIKAETEKKDVIYPSFNNERGHPPLISTRLKNKITDWNGNGGLNLCLQNCTSLCTDVPVADQTILMGANTARSYNKLVIKFNKKDLLTSQECKVLMHQVVNTPNEVVNHCKAVARIANELAENVNSVAEVKLNIDLVYSSALVHDMAKSYVYHDKVGAEILREMGCKKMGDIVGKHINLIAEKTQSITEAEIVYIADKLVCGENVIDLDTRFKGKKVEYKENPFIQDKMISRMENAYIIKDKIEKLTSQSIENILRKF